MYLHSSRPTRDNNEEKRSAGAMRRHKKKGINRIRNAASLAITRENIYNHYNADMRTAAAGLIVLASDIRESHRNLQIT